MSATDSGSSPTVFRCLFVAGILSPLAALSIGVDAGPIFQIFALEDLLLDPRLVGIALGLGTLSVPLQIWQREFLVALGLAVLVVAWSLHVVPEAPEEPVSTSSQSLYPVYCSWRRCFRCVDQRQYEPHAWAKKPNGLTEHVGEGRRIPMAAAVRVTCSPCGDQELSPGQMRARVCIETDHSEYRFTCPECNKITVLQTERRVIDLLQASGVRVDLWSLPPDLFEVHTGDRLTHDDIIDFHTVLENDTAFEQAVADLT